MLHIATTAPPHVRTRYQVVTAMPHVNDAKTRSNAIFSQTLATSEISCNDDVWLPVRRVAEVRQMRGYLARSVRVIISGGFVVDFILLCIAIQTSFCSVLKVANMLS